MLNSMNLYPMIKIKNISRMKTDPIDHQILRFQHIEKIANIIPIQMQKEIISHPL